MLLIDSVNAETIEQKLGNGLIATAEYHQGENKAPAILIIHGFLQTRESPTVANLFTALADAGYSVLAPTLSLGISHRKQSLACEAIHSHSMQVDLKEIDLWSRWLAKMASRKVILIGHSAGSVFQLAYLGGYPVDHIKNGILISLSYFGVAAASHETEADGLRARQHLKRGNMELGKYGLSYCKEYVTTAGNYLSYYDWQQKKLLTTMQKIKKPVTVIIGGSDQRISGSWVSSLKRTSSRIVTIEGAGHFFDNQYEFHLHEAIETILSVE